MGVVCWVLWWLPRPLCWLHSGGVSLPLPFPFCQLELTRSFLAVIPPLFPLAPTSLPLCPPVAPEALVICSFVLT